METSRPAHPLPRRMLGIALRHFYLYKESWPRLVEMMYWPILDIMLYGFISLSIQRRLGHAEVMTDAFLCGLMMVEFLTRTTMAMMVMYMEEVWSRNLGHLFASPLRLRDFVASLLTLGLLRCLIAVTPALVAVWLLFDYSILMRFGLAAEWLGWMSTWALVPFMAATYPVSVLPDSFQYVSRVLPGTYVFESMKHQVATGQPLYRDLAVALALNAVYFALAAWVFARSYRSARIGGGLLQMGE